MGRAPIIRNTIISILRNSKEPLRFIEIRHKAEEILKRKVHDKSIAENLSRLIREGIVEKVFKGTYVAYRLTSDYFAAQIKSTVQSIIRNTKEPLYVDLKHNSFLPYIAYIQRLKKMPVNKEIVFFWPESGSINWDEPKTVIALRMLETVNEMDDEVKEGITTLLARAYWCGTRVMIKRYGISPLLEVISESKDFAIQCLRKAIKEWKDEKRAEAERAIISILDITRGLVTKPNLKEFLLYLFENAPKVKMLQREIIKNVGRLMGAGEKIFDSFLDFHEVVLNGLHAAGIPSKRSSLWERHFYNYSNVWSNFIQQLLLLSIDKLDEIKGELEEEIHKIRALSNFFDYIRQLPFQSKVVITYLWGYPEIILSSEKSFLPWFENWFQALKQGNLDHRIWIFKNIEKVRRAYRAVRRNREPLPDLIDLEPWTLRDLYSYHPRGKDSDFWEELLNELTKRKENLRC